MPPRASTATDQRRLDFEPRAERRRGSAMPRPRVVVAVRKRHRRSGRATGSGASSRRCTRLKTALLAPMATASVATTTAVNAGRAAQAPDGVRQVAAEVAEEPSVHRAPVPAFFGGGDRRRRRRGGLWRRAPRARGRSPMPSRTSAARSDLKLAAAPGPSSFLPELPPWKCPSRDGDRARRRRANIGNTHPPPPLSGTVAAASWLALGLEHAASSPSTKRRHAWCSVSSCFRPARVMA